jgi:uncharacterized BrkB/YihY/UPF0761 family membrane protein
MQEGQSEYPSVSKLNYSMSDMYSAQARYINVQTLLSVLWVIAAVLAIAFLVILVVCGVLLARYINNLGLPNISDFGY